MAITKFDLVAAENPIPGDPDMIAAAANDYANLAESIGDAVNTLDDITGRNATLRGQSVTALQQELTEIRDQLSKVQTSYRKTSTALDTYHPVLRNCKDAVEAIQVIVRSRDEALRDAQEKRCSIEDKLSQLITQPLSSEEYFEEHSQLLRSSNNLETRIANLNTQIDGYVDEANTHYNTSLQAAQTAADTITSSLDSSMVDAWNESGQKILQGASEAGRTFAFWLGILSLGAVPLSGGASYWLATASFGTAAATLGIDVVLLTQYDEGTWEGVLIDGAFLVLPGAGKLASKFPGFRNFKGPNARLAEDVEAARKSVLATGPVKTPPVNGFDKSPAFEVLDKVWRSLGENTGSVEQLNRLIQWKPLTAADIVLINQALESQGIAFRWNVAKKVYECVGEPVVNAGVKEAVGVE